MYSCSGLQLHFAAVDTCCDWLWLRYEYKINDGGYQSENRGTGNEGLTRVYCESNSAGLETNVAEYHNPSAAERR